jgi:prepilin-type N-terminal cleavage/methylation domain-containing protein
MSLHSATPPALGNRYALAVRSRGGRVSGFSLVELITVIAIISILAVVGMSSFKSSNLGVSTAATEVSNTLSGARQLAISKSCRTRFIIVADDQSNPEDWRLHRYAVLRVPENVADTKSATVFVAATELKELPAGVYFRKNVHTAEDTAATSKNSIFDPAGLDRIQLQGKDIKYACIEFLPNGGTSSVSNLNIFELEQAPSATQSFPNNVNYVRIGVAQYTGRVKFQRPDVK